MTRENLRPGWPGVPDRAEKIPLNFRQVRYSLNLLHTMDARIFGSTLSDITNTPPKHKSSEHASKQELTRSTLFSPQKKTPSRRSSKHPRSNFESAQSSLFGNDRKEQLRNTRFADESQSCESASGLVTRQSNEYSPDLGDGGRIVDMQLKAILKRQNLRVSAADWTTTKGKEDIRRPPSRQQIPAQFPRSPGCFSIRRSSGRSSWASPVDLGDHGAIVDDELRQKLVRQHRIAQKVSSSFDLSVLSSACPFGSMCCDCISFEKGTICSLQPDRTEYPKAAGKRRAPEGDQQNPFSSAEVLRSHTDDSDSQPAPARPGSLQLLQAGNVDGGAAGKAGSPVQYCGIRDNVFIRLDAASSGGMDAAEPPATPSPIISRDSYGDASEAESVVRSDSDARLDNHDFSAIPPAASNGQSPVTESGSASESPAARVTLRPSAGWAASPASGSLFASSRSSSVALAPGADETMGCDGSGAPAAEGGAGWWAATGGAGGEEAAWAKGLFALHAEVGSSSAHAGCARVKSAHWTGIFGGNSV
jgi:hypothetical protein